MKGLSFQLQGSNAIAPSKVNQARGPKQASRYNVRVFDSDSASQSPSSAPLPASASPPQPSSSAPPPPPQPKSTSVTLNQENLPESLRGLSATEVEDAIRQALLEKEDNPYRSKKGYEGVRRQVLVETDIVGDIIKLDKEKMAQESRRNLIIGGITTAAFAGGLLLPPSLYIRKSPEECMVPILRLKETLVSLEEIMADGRLDEVIIIAERFQEPPFNISENLFDLSTLIGYRERNNNLRIKLETKAHDVVDDLRQVDYKNFYDVRGVKKEIADNKYFGFSQKSLLGAKKGLDEYLSLVPSDIKRKGYIKFDDLKASQDALEDLE